MILDSSTALAGAAEGIQLCLMTLIPGLFPLMVLSSMFASVLRGGGMLLAGILGGYPVGAANAARCWREGNTRREDAERMLVLHNCAGPSFIFGAAAGLHPLALWGVYLASVGALWLILPKSRISTPEPFLTLPAAVRNCVGALAGVCGWVVLMRSILAVADRWVLWLLPPWLRVCVCGFLELANGITELAAVEENLRFTLAAGMIGFGGICVMMQTAGAARGLSMKRYFPGKIFQSCVCMSLAALDSAAHLSLPVWCGILSTGTICAVFLRKLENKCRNPVSLGV